MTINVDGNAVLEFNGKEFFKTLKEAHEFQEMIYQSKHTNASMSRDGNCFIVEYKCTVIIGMEDLKKIFANQVK